MYYDKICHWYSLVFAFTRLIPVECDTLLITTKYHL